MPYNIALPDGRVVTNIPDDVTPQQAKARLLEAYPDIAKMTPPAVGEFATPKPAAPAEPTPESQSVFRGAADLGLSLQTGFVNTIRAKSAALGLTGGKADKFLQDAAAHLEGLKSAASQQDSKKMAEITKSAEDKGFLEQVVAAGKAFSYSPLEFTASAIGSSIPQATLGVLGKPVQVIAGATTGAGTIKTAIYDTVYEELVKAKVPPTVCVNCMVFGSYVYLGNGAVGAAVGRLPPASWLRV